jgi:hypothetical protein
MHSDGPRTDSNNTSPDGARPFQDIRVTVKLERIDWKADRPTVVHAEPEVHWMEIGEVVVRAEADVGEHEWTVELRAVRADRNETTLVLHVDTATELARALVVQADRSRTAAVHRRRLLKTEPSRDEISAAEDGIPFGDVVDEWWND